jgi:membrane dipeptidase
LKAPPYDENVYVRQTRQPPEKLPIGYVLSLEGADSFVTLGHLERSYTEGLRAVGPAHYGPGVYAHGTDAEGPLPPKGQDLLREMDRLGMILDVTHLCDECFWDALEIFKGPVWASHQNCRVLAPWNRQFADDQIKAVIERGGKLWIRVYPDKPISRKTSRSNKPFYVFQLISLPMSAFARSSDNSVIKAPQLTR